ncbi:MAG: hypothetical protein ACK4FL_02015, partial [Microgenomates group bacterium]
EDKITESFAGRKLIFWPLINLREHLEEEKKFSFVRGKWIRKYANLWLKEVDKSFVPLPEFIENNFREFLLANWGQVIAYLEDNLRALVHAGPAGPLGQISPRSASVDVYNQVLLDLFDKFVYDFIASEKNIRELDRLAKKIIPPKQYEIKLPPTLGA